MDNEFFVPHGYLSDEEEDKDDDEVFNPEKEKVRFMQQKYLPKVDWICNTVKLTELIISTKKNRIKWSIFWFLSWNNKKKSYFKSN